MCALAGAVNCSCEFLERTDLVQEHRASIQPRTANCLTPTQTGWLDPNIRHKVSPKCAPKQRHEQQQWLLNQPAPGTGCLAIPTAALMLP